MIQLFIHISGHKYSMNPFLMPSLNLCVVDVMIDNHSTNSGLGLTT